MSTDDLFETLRDAATEACKTAESVGHPQAGGSAMRANINACAALSEAINAVEAESNKMRADLAEVLAERDALRRDLDRAHDSGRGFLAEIAMLKQQVRELRAFQAMVNRHRPEFPADPDGPRDVWYWQGDGEDRLESMTHQLPVVIRAEQLREVLAEQAKPAPAGWRFERVDERTIKVKCPTYSTPLEVGLNTGDRRALAFYNLAADLIEALAAQPASSVVGDTAPGFSSVVSAASPAEGDEPVGEMRRSALIDGLVIPVVPQELPVGTKLYTRPAQHQPKGTIEGEPEGAPWPQVVSYAGGADDAGLYGWVRIATDPAGPAVEYRRVQSPAPAPGLATLPDDETPGMHDAVMAVLYAGGGITRGNTNALWRAYRSALPAAQAPAVGDEVAELVRQSRELCAATLRAGPGVAVEIPAKLAEEGRKFMRGEPSLIEQMPFADVQKLGDLLGESDVPVQKTGGE